MNKINYNNIWPKKFSEKAIVSSLFFLFLINVLFIKYTTPFPLLLVIVPTIIVFFYYIYKCIYRWQNLSAKELYYKLFWYSILYRLIFLLIVIILTYLFDPKSLPLEMFARDAWRYLDSGTLLQDNIINGRYVTILSNYWRDQADWGFSLYLGLINTIFFNSVILVKLLNILWGSITVVLLAKTASLLYTPKHGLITGVIAMLLPSFAWFNAMYLKETLMILIIVLIFYNAIKIVKTGRFNSKSLIILLSGLLSIFYFRTILAVIISISLFIYFINNFLFSRKNKIIIITIMMIFIGGIYFASINLDKLSEVRAQYFQLESGEGNRILWKLSMVNNINVNTSYTIPLVMVNAFVSPYPSFLDFDERQIGVISHSQNEITRIIMYYFALLGMYIAFRKDFKNSSLILSFTLGYIIILALTGASYFDRFQLPAVPFMLIFISVGIINSPRKWFKKFDLYILFILLATFAWHLFKFNIRG